MCFPAIRPSPCRSRGDIGEAPVLRGAVERSPLLGLLVPSTLGERIWDAFGFMEYYDLPEMTLIANDGQMDLTAHLPLLDDTIYHTIYGNDSLLVIVLK